MCSIKNLVIGKTYEMVTIHQNSKTFAESKSCKTVVIDRVNLPKGSKLYSVIYKEVGASDFRRIRCAEDGSNINNIHSYIYQFNPVNA